jgi:SAM-dependent methyltransferase
MLWMSAEDLSAAWEANASDWLAWARTPGHDVAFWEMNAPAFGELLPAPGLGAIDVGCGEGRVGRMLSELGHSVRGLDSSPTLVQAARAAGGYEDVVCGDATKLPWSSDSCDLAIAFMCLMDMAEPAAAVREIARVLIPAGRLCIALTHPLNGTAEFLEDYFTERVFDEHVDVGGLHMRFTGRQRPIGHYTRALAEAGFVIELFQELQPTAEAIARTPRLATAAKRPWTLLIRARLE